MRGRVMQVPPRDLRRIERSARGAVYILMLAETTEDNENLKAIMKRWFTGKEIKITIKNPDPEIKEM